MELTFDLTIMLMLMITIVYAWRLNRKLNDIRTHKAELKANVEAFYKATDRAVEAVKDLKWEGTQVCKDIEDKITKARLAADEIDFMVTRANRKANEMKEEGFARSDFEQPVEFAEPATKGFADEDFVDFQEVKATRPAPKLASKQSAKSIKIKDNNGKVNSIAEAELVKALREKQMRDAMVG